MHVRAGRENEEASASHFYTDIITRHAASTGKMKKSHRAFEEIIYFAPLTDRPCYRVLLNPQKMFFFAFVLAIHQLRPLHPPVRLSERACPNTPSTHLLRLSVKDRRDFRFHLNVVAPPQPPTDVRRGGDDDNVEPMTIPTRAQTTERVRMVGRGLGGGGSRGSRRWNEQTPVHTADRSFIDPAMLG